MVNIVKSGERPAMACIVEIMIDNENELEGLKSLYAPGSIAYLAGFTRIWHLSNAHEWAEIGAAE